MDEIYESFANFPYLETCSKLFNMLEAFDRICDEGLIYKMKTIGVSDYLLKLFQSFCMIDIKESYLMSKFPLGIN